MNNALDELQGYYNLLMAQYKKIRAENAELEAKVERHLNHKRWLVTQVRLQLGKVNELKAENEALKAKNDKLIDDAVDYQVDLKMLTEQHEIVTGVDDDLMPYMDDRITELEKENEALKANSAEDFVELGDRLVRLNMINHVSLRETSTGRMQLCFGFGSGYEEQTCIIYKKEDEESPVFDNAMKVYNFIATKTMKFE